MRNALYKFKTYLLTYLLSYFTLCVCVGRRVRDIGRQSRGVDSGEVAVRAGGVRAHAVPWPADAFRQAAAAASVAAHHLGAGHRAAVLRPPRRQDADRDSHQRHAAQRRIVQLAIHVRSVAAHRTGCRSWGLEGS